MAINGDVQLTALSSGAEVWAGRGDGKLPCAFLRSFGLDMHIGRLFQSSCLQWAWRAAFLKHNQCGPQGARRWTHSGGGPYRAVIFDMGGVLIPSPGRLAAGELFLFHFQRRGGGGGKWKAIRGDGEEHGAAVGHILALESNSSHHSVVDDVWQIIQLL